MIKKISTDELILGMYVVQCGEGSFESPVIHVDKLVESEADLDRIRAIAGDTVSVDTEKSISLTHQGEKPSFADEIKLAKKAYLRALGAIKSVFNDIQRGRAPELGPATESVAYITDSLARNSNAALSLTTLKGTADYVFSHSVNVAVLSAAFGMHLGLSEELLSGLALSGLLHDVGQARISSSIIGKPARLTPMEFERVKTHPLEGFAILKHATGMSEDVARAVLEHHERFDGSGYPRGIAGVKMGIFARIVAIADVYDAMTSIRPYKDPVLPNEALKRMFKTKDTQFHPQYLEQFIKCVGIYPAGSFVRLSDGRQGIVIDANPENPLYPQVKINNSGGQSEHAPIVDLLSLNQAGENIKVDSCLDASETRIDPDKLLFSP